MTIGILTQPIGHNYGGILQAYALQTLLKQIGFTCKILDIRSSSSSRERSLLHKFLSVFVRLIKRNILCNRNTAHPMKQWNFTDRLRNAVYKKTLDFINKHIILTEQVLPRNIYVDLNEYEAFIVGSDQVWRPFYSPYQPHYFLDFLGDKKVKRIAYAASFGVAENEFSEKILKICKPLAQKFDAISVREDSGVKLCRELFNVEATHVIDPTMFFDAEHYIQLSKERSDYFNDGDCFTYILDKTDEKQRIIKRICQKHNFKPFNVMPKNKFSEVGPKHIEDCVMPPVEQWLDGFNKAKFVVTDSFHGCVFSIIFKKPFIAIGNASRGMARFESLLRMFKLEDRLIHSESDLTEQLLNSEIDYGAVHGILAKEREKAKMFLIKALS